jgi:hypothetical protein
MLAVGTWSVQLSTTPHRHVDGMEGYLHEVLTQELNRRELSALCCCHLTSLPSPHGKTPRYPIDNWVFGLWVSAKHHKL